MSKLDNTDEQLIAALRRDSRKSLSELSAIMGISRATVRTRLERLVSSGTILGFTVILKDEAKTAPVRAMMFLGIEGRGTERIVHRLNGFPSVERIHSTNGRWDLIIEIGTDSLDELDQAISDIRKIDGAMVSETNILLSTRRS